MTCRYVSRTEPRVLPGRHLDDCAGDCSGCQPCTEPHCRVCRLEHHEHTCPTCLDDTREALTEVLEMCNALPAEAEVRGASSEAFNLLGPVADWEARQNAEASYLAGRLPEGWLEATHGKDCPILDREPCTGCAGDEMHPLIVLGGWESVWREEFLHEDTGKQTVAEAGRYIAEHLAHMSTWPHVPFEDMARDIRRCRSHMEAVLHDGEQIDRGAPCPTCGTLLEKRWDVGQLGRDGWACPRCREVHTADAYDFAMRAAYIEHADWLKAVHIQQRFMVPQGTLRRWANGWHTYPGGKKVFHEPIVRKKPDGVEGRNLYNVADVQAAIEQNQESA